MNDHVTHLISAYHDGELHGASLKQVESHLLDCLECRQELEHLQQLSALLQEVSLPEPCRSPRHFTAEVKLRLRTQPAQPAWITGLKYGWRAAPLTLVGAWAFTQAVVLVSGLLMVSGSFDRFQLFRSFTSFPGMDNTLGVLNFVEVLGPALSVALLELVLTSLITVLLLGWIASWWVYQKQVVHQRNERYAFK